MHQVDILRDLVVIFAMAVVVVGLLSRMGVPLIAGFILSGMLVGPHGLGFVGDSSAVEVLAEVGVVLLLFGIGLELSLGRLRRLWRPVLVGGTLQVGLTIAATAAVAAASGLGTGSAIFVGFVVAVSSTAIVLRGLRARGEIDAPHGQLTLGILVFQDLCVLPMMLCIPLLAGGTGSLAEPALTLLWTLVGLVLVFVAARFAVPRVLELAARTRQRELFVLVVFLICLGIAWIVAGLGVSLALGAFLAGLAVADSEYRHQALSELIPLREVLTALFFVTVGMLFDPLALLRNPVPALGLLAAIVLGKFLLMILVGVVMRVPFRVNVLTAAALAQAGEFAFVLFRAAEGQGLVPDPAQDPLAMAIILSMLISPIGLAAGPRIAASVWRLGRLPLLRGVRLAEEVAGPTLHDHVIVAGYGLAGRQLAQSLGHCGVPFIVVDLNADNVRDANRLGEPVCFGDVTRPEVLEALGIERARELVLAVNDPIATETALRAVRQIAPQLPVLVRTHYVADVDRLLEAGATDVVIAEVEAAAAIAERLLERRHTGAERLASEVARIRALRSEPRN